MPTHISSQCFSAPQFWWCWCPRRDLTAPTNVRHRLTDAATLDQLQWIEIESNERLLRHQSSLPSSQPLTDWENVNNVIMMSQSEQLTRNTSITSSHLDSVSWQTEQVCFRNFWIFGPTQHTKLHKEPFTYFGGLTKCYYSGRGIRTLVNCQPHVV